MIDDCKHSLNHHWHRGDVVLLTHPPHYKEKCCYCGEEKIVQDEIPKRDPECGELLENKND